MSTNIQCFDYRGKDNEIITNDKLLVTGNQ